MNPCPSVQSMQTNYKMTWTGSIPGWFLSISSWLHKINQSTTRDTTNTQMHHRETYLKSLLLAVHPSTTLLKHSNQLSFFVLYPIHTVLIIWQQRSRCSHTAFQNTFLLMFCCFGKISYGFISHRRKMLFSLKSSLLHRLSDTIFFLFHHSALSICTVQYSGFPLPF